MAVAAVVVVVLGVLVVLFAQVVAAVAVLSTVNMVLVVTGKVLTVAREVVVLRPLVVLVVLMTRISLPAVWAEQEVRQELRLTTPLLAVMVALVALVVLPWQGTLMLHGLLPELVTDL